MLQFSHPFWVQQKGLIRAVVQIAAFFIHRRISAPRAHLVHLISFRFQGLLEVRYFAEPVTGFLTCAIESVMARDNHQDFSRRSRRFYCATEF